MPNFCLYFPVDERVGRCIRERTHEVLKGKLCIHLATDTPHITLFYGPEIEGEELKSHSREDIGGIYPGIEELKAQCFVFRCASSFVFAHSPFTHRHRRKTARYR
jgi:hypothetical protein